MSKPKNPPAEGAGVPRDQRPRHGGRFMRDPKTGALECVEATDNESADGPRGAPVAEPGSGEADTSGDDANLGSGSTSGDTSGQEG